MHIETEQPSRAHVSRAAIERLYIEMRHLLMRGSYKPVGRSGEFMKEALLLLNPQIYGSLADPEKVELNGLLYVFQRLPQGIEQCRYIKLISREGLEQSDFKAIIPSKRRRNCFRIDEEQMYIEMTRGRSDVYDILTHLTFMYNEAEKIGRNSLNSRKENNRAWMMIERIMEGKQDEEEFNEEIATTYLSILLGRTFAETAHACEAFARTPHVNDLFAICYHLGKLSNEENLKNNDREISFSTALREQLGHHVYGEEWANGFKSFLLSKGLFNRPLHVISSNMHSVMNTLYAYSALKDKDEEPSLEKIALELSKAKNGALREQVKQYALEHGMYEIEDISGTNIPVQIFDCEQLNLEPLYAELGINKPDNTSSAPVLFVMDYAFGEQAYETMDELLKPFEEGHKKLGVNIASINIMGKAGILCGDKGDIMIPTSHVFEGTADNYPVNNRLKIRDFSGYGLKVYEGTMITVLGTSLQNEDILRYFLNSSWKVIGLEMEGAHYQKAIQAASKIRRSISPNVKLRYAYYASDNPLKTGSTLASGSLGLDGVKPTYAITKSILKGIFSQ